jgi:hypothetical protein
MMRRVVLSMLAVGLVGIGAAPVVAAPGYDEADVFTITCGEDLTLDVTMGPGLGVWTPAFVIDSDQRVIPYAISGTFVREGAADIDVDAVRNAPRNERLYEACTFGDGGFGGLTGGSTDTSVSFTLTPG